MTHESYTKILNNVLSESKLKAYVKKCHIEGPFLICDLTLEPGGQVSKIIKNATEIALSIKSISEPIIQAIPSKGIVRMEFLIAKQKTVFFKDIVQSPEFIKSSFKLPLAIGKTRYGNPLVVDLVDMPHLLVAGTTGSGKSIALHSMICSLLSNPSGKRVMLALIDPKRVEFSYYENIPNLWSPIAQDVNSSLRMLTKLIDEMNNRFGILQKNHCRNITEYKKEMPYIVLVIDELSDLMMSAKREVQEMISQLAQKSRACGIHLILSTQRPSVDVITGVIKANFPARLSCHVTSAIDSRVIIDKNGAEKLSGNGDSIFDSSKYPFIRFKGSFLDEKDILDLLKKYASKSFWSKIWTTSR